MPVIQKPRDGPLFGRKSYILLGGIDKDAMRAWQERVRAGKNETPAHDEPSERGFE
jgi:hypothetical protein